MMNCSEARRHWMLYLDSEGDAELHLRIRDHIGECPACAAWFAQQQRLERGINQCLAAGKATPEMWARVLAKTGIQGPVSRRRRWAVGVLAAAVVLVVLIGLQTWGHAPSTELARNAAAWHEQWLRGNVHPDLLSTSDQEVDRYLKTKVPFRVHCPPRTDVNFTVQGAGVCYMKDHHQAAYIVGRVGQAPVSILVLDRNTLEAFSRLQDGHYRYREGDYQVVSGIIADNVVIVIGTASSEALETLLNAYGTYHEG